MGYVYYNWLLLYSSICLYDIWYKRYTCIRTVHRGSLFCFWPQPLAAADRDHPTTTRYRTFRLEPGRFWGQILGFWKIGLILSRAGPTSRPYSCLAAWWKNNRLFFGCGKSILDDWRLQSYILVFYIIKMWIYKYTLLYMCDARSNKNQKILYRYITIWCDSGSLKRWDQLLDPSRRMFI